MASGSGSEQADAWGAAALPKAPASMRGMVGEVLKAYTDFTGNGIAVTASSAAKWNSDLTDIRNRMLLDPSTFRTLIRTVFERNPLQVPDLKRYLELTTFKRALYAVHFNKSEPKVQIADDDEQYELYG